METKSNKPNIVMTPVKDARFMPEEVKIGYTYEPEVKTVLQLGEYICRNRDTIPIDLLKLTEEKGNIRELDLKHVRLDDASIGHLSVFLYFMQEIDLVDFTDMQLSPGSFLTISPSLSRLNNILELHLCSNDLSSGALHLSRTLQSLPKLAHLNLNDCKISPKDMTSLCSGLKTLKSLEILQLSLNPIGDEGCISFSEILRDLLSIVSIEMFTCGISNKGGSSLVKVLPSVNVQSFLLGNNKFSPRFENKLKKKFAFVHIGVNHNFCNLL